MIDMNKFMNNSAKLTDDEMQQISAGMTSEEYLMSLIGQQVTNTFSRCTCGNNCGTIIDAWGSSWPHFRVRCSSCNNIFET